jgi:ankyrin repeat protein
MTHLMAAAAAGQVDIVESLLSSPGIDVDETTDTGERALTMACVNGHLEVVKLLVGAGARVEQQARGWDPLEAAVLGRHLQVVKYLVEEAGADVQHVGTCGETPLIMAVMNYHVDMVNYLLGRPGIDVNQTTPRGQTALELTCFTNRLELVKLLVGAGARVNPKASSEYGPLLRAIMAGHLQVVKYLVEEAGADVQHVGPRGVTSLTYTFTSDRAAIAEYLWPIVTQLEQEKVSLPFPHRVAQHVLC